MSEKNIVELDVRLNMKSLDKDFGTLEKTAKTGAETAVNALNNVEESIGEISDQSKKCSTEVKSGVQMVTRALDEVQDSVKETSEQTKKTSKESKSASEALIASIKDQESELAFLKKSYLDIALTQGKESEEAKELGEKIEKLSSELQENCQRLKDAEYSAEDLGDAIDELGGELDDAKESASIFGDVLKGSLASAGIEKGVEIATSSMESFVSGAMEMQDANQKLQASTGATVQEMEAYSDTMEELYKNNYGDSVEDVADAMAMVRQYTSEVDPTKLQELAENAMTLEDTFENMDMSETLRGVDALMKSMGLTAEEAFDYITVGAQNGLNKSGELVDNIAEYGPLWSQAGFSAEEMFTILDNGLESGAYNLDKVNDFVKEFGISLSDGRIGENIDSFSVGTQELFNQWKNGEASTRDVFYSIINDLQNMTNQQEALTLASNVWSAVGEDNAMAVITAMDDVNSTFSDVKGSMEKLKEVRYDSLASQYKTLGRTLQMNVATPLLENFLPAAQAGINLLADNIDLIIPVATTAGTAIGAMWVTNKASELISDIRDAKKAVAEYIAKLMAKNAVTASEIALETSSTGATVANTAATTGQTVATGAATVAQQGLNAAMKANPALLLVGGVVALISVLGMLSSKVQDVSDETDTLCTETEELNAEIKETSASLKESFEGLEESIESVNAKESMADNLVAELYELDKATDKSSGEISRMSAIVDELNSMFPELSLEIDKNTGSLNKNEEQTRDSIETYLQYLKVQAAQEKMAEIAEELTEADMARYKAEKNLEKTGEELAKLEEERKELLEDSTSAAKDGTKVSSQYAAKLSGEESALGRNTAQMNRLKEAQEEQQAALDELNETYNAANEKYTEAYEYLQDLTGATNDNTESVEQRNEASKASIDQIGQELEAYNNLSTEQQELAVDLTNSVLTMQENVQGALESQMNMFEKFDGGVHLSTSKLLSNMESQIAGVQQWEQNLALLADKGINQDLLQHLAEMGPEGAGYVQTFVDMSDEELARANELWGQSIEIKAMTDEWGQELLSSGAENIAGGMEGITEVMEESGADTVMGLVKGVKAAQKDAEAAGKDLGVNLIDSVDEGLGVASPSKKTKKSGEYTGDGLILGIKNKTDAVKAAGKNIAQAAITGAEQVDMYSQGVLVGKNFGEGITVGIASTVARIASQAAAAVRTAINAANREQDAHSPAKETIEVGHNFGEGTEVGIRDKIPDVEDASTDMMHAALTVPDQSWAIHAMNEAVYSRSVAAGRLYLDYGLIQGTGASESEGVKKDFAKEVSEAVAEEISKLRFQIGKREFGRVVRECYE